jgi:hypothetical protein
MPLAAFENGVETILIGATVGTIVATIVATARTSISNRLIFGAISGMWIALVAALTAGGYLRTVATALPLTFGTYIVAMAVLAIAVPGFRTALAGIPTAYIIRLNAFRVIGIFFFVLLVQGQLGGPFPYFAGIGDILTGLFALPTARLFERNPRDPRVLFWNAFGTLDLLLAVTLGLLSGNNSPLQAIHAGAGIDALGMLPWSLIPLALVPTFLVGHVTIFARILRRQENAVTT